MAYVSPMDLNDVHKAQISRLTSFFKGKRDQCIAHQDGEKEDFKSDHNSDEGRIFNKAEMDQMLDYYHHQVMARVKEDLENAAKQAAVYQSLFLGQAEQYQITLQVDDVSVIEDRSRLDQINAIAAVTGAPPPVAQPRQQLAPIGAGVNAPPDPRVLAELQQAQEEKAQMEQRYLTMQTEMSQLLKDRSQLSAELDAIKGQFAQLVEQIPETQHSANTAQIQALLNQTEGTLDQKSAECEAMRNELNSRLADSSQFTHLKAIVKKKGEKIKYLEAYLAQHGIALPQQEGGCVELQADSD
jgi:hypothetical protein